MTPSASVARIFEPIVGLENVVVAERARALHSMDAFWQGTLPLAIVAPRSKQEVAEVLRVACGEDLAVLPRGGGMSYTKGYVASQPRSISLDMRQLNRVIEIQKVDRTMTVEAGVTWKQMYEALRPFGLRTPYFGPMSGSRATVGGTLSNNSMFYGSGVHGTAAENVLSLCVALADGTLLSTGSRGHRRGVPFHRHFGPDLTGLFLSDAGALGVKVEATFPLIDAPTSTRFASFAFETFEDLFEAQAKIARERLAAECFAFDPFLNRSLKSLGAGDSSVETAVKVARNAGSLSRAMGDVAALARGGRGVVDSVQWSLHLVVEGIDDIVTDRVLDRLRTHAALRGREIPPTVPTVIRAEPFKDPGEFLLGHGGERWQPIHACLPLSRVLDARRATEQCFDRHRAKLERFRIETSLLTAVSGTDFIFEPAFYYPDAPTAFHNDYVLDKSRLGRHASVSGAQEAVTQILEDLVRIYRDLGAVHQQLGGFYGYSEALRDENLRTLRAIKAVLDPSGVMNPGALGL